MASQPPVIDDNNDDAEFQAEFQRLAGNEPPRQEEPPADDDAEKSEGNDPATQVPAADEAPAKEDDESVTSDPADAGGDTPPADETPDPWLSAPEALRLEREQLIKERDEARHKAQSDAARVAALSRKLATAGTASATSAPAKSGEGKEPSEAQKALDAKVKQLKEDYPEVAEPMLEMLEAQREELATVQQQLTLQTEAQREAYVAAQLAILGELHPDWEAVAQTQEFGGWLAAQPEGIQRLASSLDAKETAVAISLYKTETGAAQAAEAPAKEPSAQAKAAEAKRKQQLEGGRDVRSRPAPSASGAPEDDFDAAFAHYSAKKEEELLRQGRR